MKYICPHCKDNIETTETIFLCPLCSKSCEINPETNKIIKRQYRYSTLYNYAEIYRKKIVDESDIDKIDMTYEFHDELRKMIRKGEIIQLNINSKVRKGKSTEAIAIGQTIFNMLQEEGVRPLGTQFTMSNIARDQQEFSYMMRDSNLRYTVIVTDEFNELEETGVNATTEKALSNVFSNVQAVRYVHRICCSPKEIVDPNADILLSVISVDTQLKKTWNKLYFRYHEGNMEHVQYLGKVEIYVGDLIKVFDTKMKLHFNKAVRTPADELIINDCVKNDLYCEYMWRKEQKINLLNNESIFRPRMLKHAQPYKEVIQRIMPLCKNKSLIDYDLILAFIKIKFKAYHIPMSVLGERTAVGDIKPIIMSYVRLFELKKKIQIQKFKHDDEEIESKKKIFKEIISEMLMQQDLLVEGINELWNEIEECIKLNKQYEINQDINVMVDDKIKSDKIKFKKL